MRKVLKKILEILDGTPADYGKQKGWSGQSVVELSLVTPILIVLLMGLAEVGWFANNFLILLEVSRAGARFGTSQPAETSPLVWNNDASRASNAKTGFEDIPDISSLNGADVDEFRRCDLVRDSARKELQGFYNAIACMMTQQMDPLVFDGTNKVDDIVVSAFSLYAITPEKLPTTPLRPDGGDPRVLITNSTDPGLPPGKTQVLVVGRYPTNANECTVDMNGVGKVWERDPFDYFQNTERDYQLKDLAQPLNEDTWNYVELAGYDEPSYQPYVAVDPLTLEPLPPGRQPPAKPERQRGFVFVGQHAISEVFNPVTGAKNCYGSEWSIDEVQNLMNLPGFSLLSDQRAHLPNQGMVLVELFWKHELLLKNPVFNPVWTILGDNTNVSVWAAFPLPATEPRITFN
jgi:hypothetical protein